MSNRWHNKGQQDRAGSKPYRAPHGIIRDLTTWTSGGMRRISEDNSQYRKGWENTEVAAEKIARLGKHVEAEGELTTNSQSADTHFQHSEYIAAVSRREGV